MKQKAKNKHALRTLNTPGKRIRYIRDYLQLNQQNLAAASGVAQQTISKIERDLVVKNTYLFDLAYALKVHPQWIFFGKGEPFEEINEEDKELLEWEVMERQELRNVEKYPKVVNLPVVTWDELNTWMSTEHAQRNLGDEPMIELKDETLTSQDSAAIPVTDDGMIDLDNPFNSIPPGTKVIVDFKKAPTKGSIVLLKCKNPTAFFLRQYLPDGSQIRLRAFNPAYHSFDLDENINILGTATAILKEL